MTLTSSNEINDSVRELDRLLDDLREAQTHDEICHTKRLTEQSRMYNSTASLYVPGQSANRTGSRPSSSASGRTALRNLASQSQSELDEYTMKLQHEMARNHSDSNRGVLVKDVVEEEILVDHIQYQPKQQQTDRKFITNQQSKPTDRSHKPKRQVAFAVPTSNNRNNHYNYDDTESYDNTDDENQENYELGKHTHKDQAKSSSMLSLDSVATDQSAQTDTSSVLDPNKIINCYVCGERVVGQVITALGRNYHREHFTCAHCHQELGTRNFYERDNLPYCEKDYQQLFSPKCAACANPILDKVTIALDQTFHPEHFVCAHCGCQFDIDDGFHEKDGKPYCKNDFFELFANKCASCHLPITANYITALGTQWHPDCFVCSDCHCPFADGKFFDIDGAPYCEIHYHARKGSLCAVCREPIIGKCTTAMFRKFHPHHFTCTYCLKVLSKSFKEENDKPYCHDCFDKLYS